MRPATDRSGVELLERALGYTRGALQPVRPAHLTRPTPCTGWSLDALLDHMDDALDAFTDGAEGLIAVEPGPRPLGTRVETLQVKACALLGAWSLPTTGPTVVVGGASLPTAVVVRAAALEITVHGWDVARTTGRGPLLPAALAADLLPVAHALVDPLDRGTRFAPAYADDAAAPPEARLLGFLGRSVDPRRLSA
ncbi:TIGR03086 family metal-binding protein [Nocardioides litoris]|uniref:TIGR03086 family metal-binding protein n=1 Tax=Nocardioides litoris TaxID=1926648 RepID=UPI0011204867|nr:TIGR03086 family metal-binding protein [Nocardioides litoris]